MWGGGGDLPCASRPTVKLMQFTVGPVHSKMRGLLPRRRQGRHWWACVSFKQASYCFFEGLGLLGPSLQPSNALVYLTMLALSYPPGFLPDAVGLANCCLPAQRGMFVCE